MARHIITKADCYLNRAKEHTAKDDTPRYTAEIRLKGYPTQTATFKRLTDARKWIASTESAIREGRCFKTAEAKRHTVTVAELIDHYIKDVLLSKPKQAIQRPMKTCT